MSLPEAAKTKPGREVRRNEGIAGQYVCRRATKRLKSHATEAAGQPRGKQMLVQALSEFRNLETALEANSWKEIREIPQRGSEPEIAQVCLPKESRVKEDDAGGQ